MNSNVTSLLHSMLENNNENEVWNVSGSAANGSFCQLLQRLVIMLEANAGPSGLLISTLHRMG